MESSPRPRPRPLSAAAPAPDASPTAGPVPVTDDAPLLPGDRPRPAPRPVPAPALTPAPRAPRIAGADEPLALPESGPGLAARLATVRHNPLALKRGAFGAICAGIALFAAASVALPLAAADTASNPAPVALPSSTSRALPLTLPTGTASTPPARKTVATKPTIVTKQAPVTKAVITGLARNGIPKVALNAYRVAAARMASADPGCGVRWWLLAGIGREESNHGRFAGAVLEPDGTSSPPIVGPALDGVHWDYIPASAQYIAITHDRTYAHALGPMQFIPSTWAAYGTDANGDHKADIFNINDAALGAARYLCAAGGNLRTHAGQVAAVLAYNHNDEYLSQVLALANAYRTGVPVTGIPVIGITKGALPKLPKSGYLPPVNPGPPTAVGKVASAPGKASAPARGGAARGGAAGAAGGGGAVSGRAGSSKPVGKGGAKTTRAPVKSTVGGGDGAAAPSPAKTTPKPILQLPTLPPLKLPTIPKPSKTCTLILITFSCY